jgi:phytoene dehydrogenase-like protein
MNVAIVGAGLAGLATALAFEKAGHEVHVYESSNNIGGRMSTTWVDGYPIDVGFHVLHTAYPTLHRWCNVDALEPRAMSKCSFFYDKKSGKQERLGDGLASPRHLLPTLRAIGIRDGLRLLRWRLSTRRKNLDRFSDATNETIYGLIQSKKFSTKTTRYLELLFTGITLDPELSDDARFAHFTWSAMSHGSMVMLKKGIQSVPSQLYARLERTQFHFNQRITSISNSSVHTDSSSHNADIIILATPSHVVNKLLKNQSDTSPPRKTKMFCFQMRDAPFHHPAMILSSSWQPNHKSILHIQMPTLLHPKKDGNHILCATVVGDDVDAANEDDIHNELIEWFGPQAQDWTFFASTELSNALPMSSKKNKLNFNTPNNVHIVGDHTVHGSVQGTLESVENLLAQLNIPLPR